MKLKCNSDISIMSSEACMKGALNLFPESELGLSLSRLHKGY